MSGLVEHFRRAAKTLVKTVATADTAAIARVRAVRREGVANFGLMKAQHVVAVEAGFADWKALLDADEGTLRAAIARRKQSSGSPDAPDAEP